MERKKEDRRTRYSKMVIRDTLFELMREKPINKITVKELCEKADVNRSTFYAYYADIYDLNRHIIKELFIHQREFINKSIEILSSTPDITKLTLEDYYKIAYAYLSIVKENKELYSFIFHGQANSPVQISYDKVYFSQINKRLPEKYRESFKRSFSFVSGGTTAFFIRWILNDCKEPLEDMAKSLAYYYHGVFNGHKLNKH